MLIIFGMDHDLYSKGASLLHQSHELSVKHSLVLPENYFTSHEATVAIHSQLSITCGCFPCVSQKCHPEKAWVRFQLDILKNNDVMELLILIGPKASNMESPDCGPYIRV
jgi:hypothetical protein